MRIGIDFDGVIIDTSQVKIMFCQDKFGVTISPERICGGGAKMKQGGPLNPTQYIEMKDFDFGEGTLLGEVVKDAKEVLGRFIADGHKVIIVTSRHLKGGRMAQKFLKQHKIPYHHFVSIGDKKQYKGEEMTKRIAINVLKLGALIDDQYPTLSVASGTGAKLFLFNQPWNESIKIVHPDILRALGWKHIYSMLQKAEVKAA